MGQLRTGHVPKSNELIPALETVEDVPVIRWSGFYRLDVLNRDVRRVGPGTDGFCA